MLELASSQCRDAVGFADRLYWYRNRLLANQNFRLKISKIPILRRIGQQRASTLFDICAGFVYSQVLMAAVQLELFSLLAQSPLERSALAARSGIPRSSMDRLVDACIALKLMEARRHGRVGLSSLGAIIAGDAGIRAMVQHHAMLYRDMSDPVELLRRNEKNTATSRLWPYALSSANAHQAAKSDFTASAVNDYTRLMSFSQPMVAEQVLSAINPVDSKVWLDVGGGDGTFLQALKTHHPHLVIRLFDLPAVVEYAQQKYRSQPGSHQFESLCGDMFSDSLPVGADTISLIRVLHDHDDAQVEKLLRNVFDALPAGGRIVIAEPMSNTAAHDRMADAYFGFYLLAMGSGRPRSPAQFNRVLQKTGFIRMRRHRSGTPMIAAVITAQKPSN